MSDTEHSTHLNATRARQGRYGKHMLWVLVASTLLAAAGLFAAWTFKAHDLALSNSNNGAPQTAAPAFSSSAPPAVAAQTSPTATLGDTPKP